MHAGTLTGVRMATAAFLALFSATLLGTAFAASVSRTDNSPVCNSYAPACEAKCRQGQDFMFVCSAGNGPNGGPYVLCQCVAAAMPVGPPQQVAKLVLSNWPGSKACNDKTWINDCTSQITSLINGTQVTMTPAVSSAFNEQCDPAPGVVIGPKGMQAAISFPQYPIALTNTGPDGTLTLDFSATASDDPNQMDWSQCIVTYKIIQGTFLPPPVGMQANRNAMANQQAYQQTANSAGSNSHALGLLQFISLAWVGLTLLL